MVGMNEDGGGGACVNMNAMTSMVWLVTSMEQKGKYRFIAWAFAVHTNRFMCT